MATTGPMMTVGAEKNVTTEARFPQRRSIRWTLQSARTSAGGRGGQWNNATATDDDGDNGGIVKERRQTGGGEVVDAARKSEHSAAHCCLLIPLHGERIARAVCKNGVVILAGLTRSSK